MQNIAASILNEVQPLRVFGKPILSIYAGLVVAKGDADTFLAYRLCPLFSPLAPANAAYLSRLLCLSSTTHPTKPGPTSLFERLTLTNTASWTCKPSHSSSEAQLLPL